ncbi:hypothetical protein BV25DRAFT_1912183 [Artomyces pyxidatus]|uniref:Uncharacterized protein n=2 Tax=Artomyces pyxidatus TaxID=48021 RepID=A0ACB8SFP9_9AGAM|nr:hypothetical protein BV25DRAFT_1922429 [Artomyces pyxidatus]KAI0066812.1 hypothetical protein BV25DRAFT_1912183 [Artomyces pyxidatus]
MPSPWDVLDRLSNSTSLMIFGVSFVSVIKDSYANIYGPSGKLLAAENWLKEGREIIDRIAKEDPQDLEGLDGVMLKSLEQLESIYQDCSDMHCEHKHTYLESPENRTLSHRELQDALKALVELVGELRVDALRTSTYAASRRKARIQNMAKVASVANQMGPHVFTPAESYAETTQTSAQLNAPV